MKISAESAQRALAAIDAIFAQVGQQLDGRDYLVGDHFTAADLTFAALAAPLLLPPAGFGAWLPSLDDFPPDFPGRALRTSRAGQHALQMYRLHRGPQLSHL